MGGRGGTRGDAIHAWPPGPFGRNPRLADWPRRTKSCCLPYRRHRAQPQSIPMGGPYSEVNSILYSGWQPARLPAASRSRTRAQGRPSAAPARDGGLQCTGTNARLAMLGLQCKACSGWEPVLGLQCQACSGWEPVFGLQCQACSGWAPVPGLQCHVYCARPPVLRLLCSGSSARPAFAPPQRTGSSAGPTFAPPQRTGSPRA